MIKIEIPDKTEPNLAAFGAFNKEHHAGYEVAANAESLGREIFSVRQALHAHGWDTPLDSDLRYLVHEIREQYAAAGLVTYTNDQIPVVGAAEKVSDGLAEAVVYTLWLYVAAPNSELALVRYESHLCGEDYTLFALNATHQDDRRVLGSMVCTGAPTLRDLSDLHRDIASKKSARSKNSPKPSAIARKKKGEIFRVTAVESVSVKEAPFLTREENSGAEPESQDPSFATAEEAFAVYAE